MGVLFRDENVWLQRPKSHDKLLTEDAMLGEMDLIIIGGIALLLFGPKKIPDLMKGLGHGLKEFKKA
jgi:TatA/E family protein of Tat protein translocase